MKIVYMIAIMTILILGFTTVESRRRRSLRRTSGDCYYKKNPTDTIPTACDTTSNYCSLSPEGCHPKLPSGKRCYGKHMCQSGSCIPIHDDGGFAYMHKCG